jgi:hypothetical protein
MKIFNVAIVAIVLALFTGCTINNSNLSTTQENDQTGFSSKQIEQKIKWKYCEGETF